VQKEVETKKVFPGYVLVEMVMTDDSWYVVRNTPGVTGFVGSTGAGSKPTALRPEEADTILKQMGIEIPKIRVDFAL
ncbi:transcription termination/antitermination NusG family protein, partial [Bacillus sp. SIMBA_069]